MELANFRDRSIELAALTNELQATLSDNAALRRELQHRVRNNLAIISSLLTIHAQGLDGSCTWRLRAVQNRVSSLAIVHEQLSSLKGDQVSFDNCVRHLTYRLHASDPAWAAIPVDVQLDPVCLTLDQAVPAAMILNELLSNAFRHAFPDSTTDAMVNVQLRHGAGTRVTLTVTDNGIGLRRASSDTTLNGMGLQLIPLFARQLDGSTTCRTECGISFELSFPAGL